jgi:hypothetical protein
MNVEIEKTWKEALGYSDFPNKLCSLLCWCVMESKIQCTYLMAELDGKTGELAGQDWIGTCQKWHYQTFHFGN